MSRAKRSMRATIRPRNVREINKTDGCAFVFSPFLARGRTESGKVKGSRDAGSISLYRAAHVERSEKLLHVYATRPRITCPDKAQSRAHKAAREGSDGAVALKITPLIRTTGGREAEQRRAREEASEKVFLFGHCTCPSSGYFIARSIRRMTKFLMLKLKPDGYL